MEKSFLKLLKAEDEAVYNVERARDHLDIYRKELMKSRKEYDEAISEYEKDKKYASECMKEIKKEYFEKDKKRISECENELAEAEEKLLQVRKELKNYIAYLEAL